MKISLFFLFVLFPVIFWSQEPPSMYVKESQPFGGIPEVKVQDFYNEDGTFQRIENGKVIAKGTHINKILDGPFTEYDSKGEVKRKCTYRMGELHGEEVRYDFLNVTYTKQFDLGVQVGYEINDCPQQNRYSRTGPYFKGKKSESFVFTSTSSSPRFDQKGTILLREDSIFFTPNKPVEIHRWMFTKTNDYVRDTLYHTISFLLDQGKDTYSMEDVKKAQNIESGTSYPYDPATAYKGLEVYGYHKNGALTSKKVEKYVLTYYSNGILQDSILSSHETQPYYHYRNDSLGIPLFRSKFEFLQGEKVKRLTFDYLKNNQTFYTVTSVNHVPEKVTSLNDSIQQCIRSGEVTDYYQTHYMTKPDGRIDTSYSKQVFPFRYQTPLKEGKYYFLPGQIEKRVLVLEVLNDHVFTYEKAFDKVLKNRDTIQMKMVMQHENCYYLSESTYPSEDSKKMWVENGRIYSVDWQTKTSYSDRDRWIDYSIEALPDRILSDTLFYFKTALFTQQEFDKSLKLKSILKMPKTEFNKFLEEISVIRIKEKDALSHFSNEEREKVSLASKAICQVFYTHGYNPYFSEEEFSQLMTSYGWTKEEERAIKNVLRR